jgi:S-adenosylmethionine hydrolase
VLPAFWTIARDGHVNVNDEERRLAFDTLVLWIRTGRRPDDQDATRQAKVGASRVQSISGGFETRVTNIEQPYGNLTLNAQPSDVEGLGIRLGDRFRVSYGEKAASVTWGTTYTDVPRGEWVAFPSADGFVVLVRNFESASATLGISDSSAVLRVERMPTP